jgi:hypothetical protein
MYSSGAGSSSWSCGSAGADVSADGSVVAGSLVGGCGDIGSSGGVIGWSGGCGVGCAAGSGVGCVGGSAAGCPVGGCGAVLGGVVGDCAAPTTGRPSTAAVARVVVHLVIERFIVAPPEHGVDENEAFRQRFV